MLGIVVGLRWGITISKIACLTVFAFGRRFDQRIALAPSRQRGGFPPPPVS